MFCTLARTALAGLALLLVASLAGFTALVWQINHTGARDLAQPADAIIILGARVEADGRPGPDLRARTLHGVRLFQRGLAPYLVCTGGYQDDRLSAAAVACELAIAQGIPVDKALLADGAMTTQEDAISAHALLVAHDLESAILVSHPLHLERARMLFEDEGILVYPSPTSTDLAAIPWPSRAWLSFREAAGIISIAMESLGFPHDWTSQLGRWIYGSLAVPSSRSN